MAMEFADMLASSVHDIKNSLSVISSSLADLLHNPDNHFTDARQASILEHEVQRANQNLVQLLLLYKLGNNGLLVDICEHAVEELFAELVANHAGVCQALGVELHCQCDPALSGYFDSELLHSVLASSIGNARRYADQQILLTAAIEQDYLVMRVEDDGAGFPAALVELPTDSETALAAMPLSGRTRLGLLFAHKISQLHRAGERRGFIRLRNQHTLSGGCFEVWLP